MFVDTGILILFHVQEISLPYEELEKHLIKAKLEANKANKLVQVKMLEAEKARKQAEAEHNRATRVVGKVLRRCKEYQSMAKKNRAHEALTEPSLSNHTSSVLALKKETSSLLDSLDETEHELHQARRKAQAAHSLAVENRRLHREAEVCPHCS